MSTRPEPRLPEPGRKPKAIEGRRRTWALITSVLLAVLVVGIFFCWVIAIWHPWGHAQEWGSTGAAALFPAFILGFTSAILWTGGES